MALKPVAVVGDASASEGSLPYTGATRGTWTPGTPSETSYDVLTVGGTKVIYEVSCDFTFLGDSAPPQTVGDVNGSETVTLTASGTTQQGGMDKVLVDGDSEVSSYGNTVSISAGGMLRSKK